MEFAWPVALLATAVVPLLVWGYVVLGRRRRIVADLLADRRLLGALVTQPPPWQPAVLAALYVAGVLALALAAARPLAVIPIPVNLAAVVVAIDTSKSMTAPDVQPTRVAYAQRLARALADRAPRSMRIGLVAFSEYGTLLLAPTTDRAALAEALERLTPQTSTSMGGGILEALRVLPGRAQFLGERLERMRQRARPGGSQAPGGGPSPGLPSPDQMPPSQMPGLSPERPVSADELPPASILVFSDGVSNFGPDPAQAAALAREALVRIYAFGTGTRAGAVMRVDGQLVLAPFDADSLERISQATGGRYVAEAGEGEIAAVAGELRSALGWERRRTEISFLLTGMAGLFILAGGGLSMVWFRRVP